MVIDKLNTPLELSYPMAANIEANYKNASELATIFYRKYLRKMRKKQINLICRGSSGSIMATIFYTVIKSISPKKNVKIIYVRKDKDDSHGCKADGFRHWNDVVQIFVDDFISSGETFEACLKDLKKINSQFSFDYAVVGSNNSWGFQKKYDNDLKVLFTSIM